MISIDCIKFHLSQLISWFLFGFPFWLDYGWIFATGKWCLSKVLHKISSRRMIVNLWVKVLLRLALIFSCQEQLIWSPYHSLTLSVTHWLYFYFWLNKSDHRDLRHLINEVRRHDLTNKKTKTKTKTMTNEEHPGPQWTILDLWLLGHWLHFWQLKTTISTFTVTLQ